MADITVGELSNNVEQLKGDISDLVSKLGGLEKNTVLVADVDPDRCAPIIVQPPQMIQNCISPVKTVEREVTVEDLLHTLEMINGWIGDIHAVIERLDPGVPLPSIPETTE